MFKCQRCGQQSVPREKSKLVVQATRPKVYLDEKTRQIIGEGWEIAKEAQWCLPCTTLYEGQHAA